MPCGVSNDEERQGKTPTGSLDLIAANEALSLLATGQRPTTGENGDIEVRDIRLPHESVDLAIVNPPFARPPDHESTDVPVPSFAGFRTSGIERRAMSHRLSRICRSLDRPAGNGNAGLASNLVDLVRAKVKSGGVVAFVLPITSVQGRSWQSTRDVLPRDHSNIVVVTIVSAGSADRAFSEDTGMAEALVLAARR